MLCFPNDITILSSFLHDRSVFSCHGSIISLILLLFESYIEKSGLILWTPNIFVKVYKYLNESKYN